MERGQRLTDSEIEQCENYVKALERIVICEAEMILMEAAPLSNIHTHIAFINKLAEYHEVLADLKATMRAVGKDLF